MTNWADATHNRLVAQLQAVVDALICPRCGAANRPGVRYITVDDDLADCSVCAYTWQLSEVDVV